MKKVIETTRELTKKEKIVVEKSSMDRISEIIATHGRCTIVNPTLALILEIDKNDGGSFRMCVIFGKCMETDAIGWYQISGDGAAAGNIMEDVREMSGEDEPYAIRIELKDSKKEKGRKYYSVSII